MRRLVALATLFVAAAAVLVGASGGDAAKRTYRVDAVFDRTAALIPGQQVKVAGAPVGTVKDIVLTPQRKARVEMEVQQGFAPFTPDARGLPAASPSALTTTGSGKRSTAFTASSNPSATANLAVGIW